MNKKNKIVLIVAAGIVGLTVVVFLYIQVVKSQYRNSIPVYSGSTILSLELKGQIQDAIKLAHRKPSAKNIGDLGMVFHSSANYAEAAQCYQLAIEKSISSWEWSYYLAHLNMELGKPDIVVENLNAVLEINPDVHLAWYYLGETYSNLGENDLAEKAFFTITGKNNIPSAKETTRIDHFPLSVYAMFQLSKIYLDSERPELAEEKLKKLIDKNELFGPAYRLLGNIYTMKGAVLLGQVFNVRANDLMLLSQPVDTLVDKLALLSRSELYLLKKIDEATQNSYSDWGIKLTEHGMEYMPDNKYLISKAIELYLWKGQNQKAARLIIQHKNAFKDNYTEMGKMGTLFFQEGKYEEAKDYLTIAWALNSDNIEVLEKIAISFWKMGDKQKALEILTEAAASYQDNPENLAGIAYTFIRIGNTEKATLYLKKLKQLSPQNPKVQKLAGKIAETKGNLTDAMTHYESSFKGDPKDSETINSLGNLIKGFKMWDKYLKFYKEVILYHPNNSEYLNNLGSFLIACPDKSLRNLDEGLNYSKRAFINISSPPLIMLTSGKNLAIAYAAKGDKQKALKTMEKTILISQSANASKVVQEDLVQLYRSIQEL